MRIGVSALTFSYQCGLLGQGTSREVSHPMTVDDLMVLASRAGLQSVEFPVAMLPDLSSDRLDALHARLISSGLIAVLTSEAVYVPHLEQVIPAAARLGVRVLRVLLSDAIEGVRGGVSGGWEAHIDEMIKRLQHLRPLAEQYNVCLAVENHQDARSEDLLRVCAEVGGDHIGVAFDPVNALIVAEDPLTALEALGAHIRGIHLADYLVYPSDEGYRLVRCALGEGGMDFRVFFDRVRSIAPNVFCQIELVSHNARHVRLLTNEWWEGYGPRDVRALLPMLRLMAQNLRILDDDWRTPWERGASEAMIKLYEDQQFADSIAYLRSIGALERERF